MEFAYSPHREGGTFQHLPSPTHPHSCHMDGFASIQQIRRSLSRSPSKPSRFHLRRPTTDTPASPISPLALSRAFTPKHSKDASSVGSFPVSPLAAQAATTSKKKFSLRRTAGFRSSPRNRGIQKSPRRALGDSLHQGNASPFVTALRTSGDENANLRYASPEPTAKVREEQKSPSLRFQNDTPIKFEFARARPDTNAPGANCLLAPKSSPLKRSDVAMSTESGHKDSPLPKRRSLHGSSSLGIDFDVFDSAPSQRTAAEEPSRSLDIDMANSGSLFSSPSSRTNSPVRRSLSLRRSTLSQRGTGTPRPRPAQDHEFAVPGLAASKTRHRFSVDGSSLMTGSATPPTAFRRTLPFESIRPSAPLRAGSGTSQPHPLSNTLTRSSSASSSNGDETPTHAPPPAPPNAPLKNHMFSRSLPLGVTRPIGAPYAEPTDGTFETPIAYKNAKPLPAAFMSTGLISKKNRNADLPGPDSFASYVMPDTPSKRMSFPPITATPSFSRSIFGKPSQPRPEFGTPSTPFSAHASKVAPETFGKGVSIFGTRNSSLSRRGSFASIDIECDDKPDSPSGNRMTDSQSSNEDMPPTPTKQYDGPGRRSLRSTLLDRRTSLNPSTFVPPESEEIVTYDESPERTNNVTPAPARTPQQTTPHTPQESFTPPDASFTPPDPSSLSISARSNRRDSFQFNCSTASLSFPPATPTAPRDNSLFFGRSHAGIPPITGLTKNDVDLSLKSRFHSVNLWGSGEFSEVYRVQHPVAESNPLESPHSNKVWAVKKAKKPYLGALDQEKKLREVRILQKLRGHDHVVSYADHWEHQGHLYIQTEFCENGNLRNFLANAGCHSRLDDFRIWKILLELAQGIKHIHDMDVIHLDLKPANILVDWEGCLKIADFGLASTWPAPRGIDGEGDRNYIASEVLAGRFDKPADVFALGMIMFEIAANVEPPENGASWQRLRSGDFSEVQSLVWSSESSLVRDREGHPLKDSVQTLCTSTDSEEDAFKVLSHVPSSVYGPEELVTPPNFMIDPTDPESLDTMVHWMMNPNPDERPTIDQVCECGGVRWVESRRRAGATIYEGNWGPSDDVLGLHQDNEADMMDTS